MECDGKESRIIIRARVTDIPGDPYRRPITLGDLFCTQVLRRSFNTTITASSFDFVNIPQGFDSDDPVKRWFIYDLNVACRPEPQDLLERVPHQVYQASFIDDKW